MRAQWIRCGAGGMLAAGLIACLPAQAQTLDAPLGASVEGFRAAGRGMSPGLRAAALDSEAASAKAAGADALDDPTITDSYQYYRNPGVFSGHTVMLSQSFPLWGKRSLRREAALADVDASRGRELAAQTELDEKIKIAYAQYYLTSRDIAVNQEIAELARRMRKAATARYGQGGGDQSAVILAAGEETTAKLEAARLEGEKSAVRARLNILVGRAADKPLVDPERLRSLPATEPDFAALIARARTANPTLAASTAAVSAAQTRRTLADKAWYPDLTIGAGPVVQTNHEPVGFAATIGFNIPLGWGREASGQREAAAQLGATQQRYEAVRLEIEGALGEAIAKLRAARATETLLRSEAMPQARAVFQTILANYSQGKGELTAAINAEHQRHDVDRRLLQVQLDEQVELAAIERLIGSDL
jgi:outer membrane protein, heavy metal efflux system